MTVSQFHRVTFVYRLYYSFWLKRLKTVTSSLVVKSRQLNPISPKPTNLCFGFYIVGALVHSDDLPGAVFGGSNLGRGCAGEPQSLLSATTLAEFAEY